MRATSAAAPRSSTWTCARSWATSARRRSSSPAPTTPRRRPSTASASSRASPARAWRSSTTPRTSPTSSSRRPSRGCWTSTSPGSTGSYRHAAMRSRSPSSTSRRVPRMADAALEPFAALIGTWATEATHPQLDGVVAGRVTYEWVEGGHFLVQRSHNDHEQFPDAITVIGAPEEGGGLVAEYFDSRGVRRTYGVSFEGGVLRMWRDAPGFDQRFSATPAPDGFEGRWQLARAPDDWRDDLRVVYRRA